MPRYALITFGCQMNVHDSERMSEVLEGAGYARTEHPADADLILLNTCSVREKAEQKLRSEVGRLARLKRRRPELVLAVAGCVAQQEGERLLTSMPAVDLVLGPDNAAELPELLAELALGGPPRVRTEFDLERPLFLSARAATPATAGLVSLRRRRRRAPSAYVTVMKGCDERCSFCIVPTTRGPERYRPASEILAEVAFLAAEGVAEVTLLGQTVNSYRDPERSLSPAPGADAGRWRATRGRRANDDESEFSALLYAIARRVPALKRLRYTSPHPRHLTPSLILAHRDLDALPPHVHLPVQSGSDRMLRRMLRRYTVAEYLERTDALRAAVPGLTLSTDIIVGFPGETEEEFLATLSLVERVGFSGVFAFKYSERPGTPAMKLGDDVPETEKSARLAALFELSETLKRQHLQALVGSTQEVLCEGRGRTQSGTLTLYTGRTAGNDIAHFASPSDPTGSLVPLIVTQAFKHSLFGELARVPSTNASATADEVHDLDDVAVGEDGTRVLGSWHDLPVSFHGDRPAGEVEQLEQTGDGEARGQGSALAVHGDLHR